MIKNSIIGLLLVCIIVIFSFVYKDSRTPILGKFPVENQRLINTPGEPTIYLYFFFSRHHCSVCLETIEVLNELPSQFVVTGIVPAGELNKESEFRNATGAAFNLITFKESYKRFTPNYAPALFGKK